MNSRSVARRVSSLALVVMVMTTAATTSAGERGDAIRAGHNLLQDGASRPALAIGETLSALAVRDVTGETIRVTKLTRKGPVALVFLSTTCPLAKRYVSRLQLLYETFAGKGVSLVGVFPNGDETLEGVREYGKSARYTFPVVRDVNGYIARRVGATMTPQAFVFGRDARLAYRGAIDDNRYENRVKRRYLADALTAVLAGATVPVATTRAMGCSVHLPEPGSDAEVTYTTHIARILQDNCQSCHRPGEVGPFSLTNYTEARRWRKEIKAYTEKRLMPPWKAAPGFGHFKNDMSLRAEEIALIGKWVESGAPCGEPEDLPPEPVFPEGWAFGEPDLIVEMPEEYVVAPEGEDDYRHFVIPYEHDNHRFIEAIDVRPGNRSTVHHVLAYVDTSGKARKLDAEDPGPGYTRFGDVGFKPASVIGGWAPGNLPRKVPAGTGRWLPKKGDIVLQVHYYRTGIEERDRTRVGIYFSRSKRPVPTRVGVVINRDFTVLPGESRKEVRASLEVDQPVYAFSVTPHMHLIGETMVVTAALPDGRSIPLVRIDDWDFNWQTSYHFRELQYFPAGTRIELVATFDNSADNPNNPNNPLKPISWGEKTTDEMCIAFVGWLRVSEYDPATRGRRTEPLQTD